MEIRGIAKIAHEINRAYCESIYDCSQLPWDDAPAWQKESVINGVKFHQENPGASPSASHESWLKEKKANGWKYGEVKDADKKTHPCFVDFNDLKADQKSKGFLFKAIVNQLTDV